MSVKDVFQGIFQGNAWKSRASVSGRGSSLKATRLIRESLPPKLAMLNIRTLVDAPCGDLHWMQHLNYQFDHYIGVDIVPELIDGLTERFPDREFRVGDIVTETLPHADAILCRDCLVHLPFELGMQALDRFRAAGFRYALLTTFPGRQNRDIPAGKWRPLDMCAAPFNLPEPIDLLQERRTNPDDRHNDKRLGIWRLADSPAIA